MRTREPDEDVMRRTVMRRKRNLPNASPEAPKPEGETQTPSGNSRREFLKSSAGALGVAAAALGSGTLVGPVLAQSRRIVLKDGIVMSLDPRVGDFEKIGRASCRERV